MSRTSLARLRVFDSDEEPKPCPCGKPDCFLPAPIVTGWRKAGSVLEEWLVSQGLTLEEAVADDRRPEMVAIRRAMAVYLRDHGWSYPMIGGFLRRDHTTAMHLILEPPKERHA